MLRSAYVPDFIKESLFYMPILVKVLLFIVVVGINSLNANASVNNISPTQDINGTAQNDSATAPKSTYTTEPKPADSIEFEPSNTTEIEPTGTIEPEPDEATEPTNTTEPKATPAPQETYDEFELETGNLYLSPETLEWIDVQHNTWSQDVSYIGAYLDNFMGNSEIFQDNNKSFLKIYFDLD